MSSSHPHEVSPETLVRSHIPPTPHENGVRLLSMDGGGVRGVASLIVLDRIMKRVQEQIKSTEPCRPVDFFELAGGTSTGGIIGIMLFRLHMTAADALMEYFKIGEQIFSPKLFGLNIGWAGSWVASMVGSAKLLFKSSRFDDKDLNKAIDRIVSTYGLDDADKTAMGKAPLLHRKAGRMFLCTTAKNKEETALFRSYDWDAPANSSALNNALKKGQHKITISLAARATSAAPSYFPEVKEKIENVDLVFWDGGLLNNNPIDQLWYSRYDLCKPNSAELPVSCVISLGTGYVKPDSKSIRLRLLGMATSVINFATNSNAKSKDFSRHMTNLNTRHGFEKTEYIRFNPPLGAAEIGLADYSKMELLKEMTETYLKSDKGYIERAANAIVPEALRKK